MLRACEDAKRAKHVLNRATVAPLVMTTFSKLDHCAQGFMQSSADACSTGVVYQFVAEYCAAESSLHFGGVALCSVTSSLLQPVRHQYQSIAKCAGKKFRDDGVVPFE